MTERPLFLCTQYNNTICNSIVDAPHCIVPQIAFGVTRGPRLVRVLPHQLWLGRGNSAQQAALGYTSPHHGASDCCAQTFRGSSARQTDVRPCTPLCADVPILQQPWRLLACTTTLASTSTCTFLASGAQLLAACAERVGALLAGAVPGRLLSHHLPFCLHCSSATNRLIHAKDKASVQLNIGHVSGARRTLLLLPAVCERAEMRHAFGDRCSSGLAGRHGLWGCSARRSHRTIRPSSMFEG